MHVYNKVVIDIETLEVLEEDSFEYFGPITHLGGKPSSGGGGGSGKVDYPDYMKTQHETWLGDIATAISTAVAGGSPFAGDAAYDPGNELQDMMDEVCWFNDLVHNLDWEADWQTAADDAKAKIDDIVDPTYMNSAVTAYSNQLADDIANEVIPKFESGMLDVNAVYSSAFVVGEAIIYARKDKEVAKYSGDLGLKFHIQRNEMITSAIGTLMDNLHQLVSAAQASAHYAVEGNRISIVAEKEKVDQDLLIEDKDARWDMDVYQYGANMLASIGGGTASPGGMEGSKGQSALGGALSGAASGGMAGYMLGGPAGAAVGAGVGGFLGLIGGLF